MDYELFKKLMCSRIKEYMPPVFQDYQPHVRQVTKVNQTKDAFCMIPPEKKSFVAIPTLYMDELYEDFARDEDLERVIILAAEVFVRWSGVEIPNVSDFSLKDSPDCIIANLINAELNEELLEKVPHTGFLDMAVIYRLVHSVTEEGVNSAIITGDMLENSDMTVRDLHRLAMENTPRMFPSRLYEGSGHGVFIMTNDPGVCGATTMLYEQDMQRLAETIGGDFFIMPTSMHEFFAIATELTDAADLAKMLAEGNEQITRPQDQLSSRIYRYAASEGKIVVEAGAGLKMETIGKLN